MKQPQMIVTSLAVLMLAGCASLYRGKVKEDDEFAPLYPATQADVCWMRWGGGGFVLGVLDLPFSVVIDTLCLPYDLLTVGKKKEAPQPAIAQQRVGQPHGSLLISGKYWPREELDRNCAAYRTTGIVLARRKEFAVAVGVVSGSSAEQAGIKLNDVILMVGTNQTSSMPLSEINRAMLPEAPGPMVDLVVRTPTEPKDRKVTLSTNPMTFEELKLKESTNAAGVIGTADVPQSKR